MGEPKSSWHRALQLEYRFDRLLADKLEQVYQLLVPDRRQQIGEQSPKPTNFASGVNDEQTRSHLCSCVLGSPEGESHDCQPDSSASRIRTGTRVQRAAGLGIPGRRV